MALRTAKQAQNAGQQFWGCTGYPDCKRTAKVCDQTDQTDQMHLATLALLYATLANSARSFFG